MGRNCKGYHFRHFDTFYESYTSKTLCDLFGISHIRATWFENLLKRRWYLPNSLAICQLSNPRCTALTNGHDTSLGLGPPWLSQVGFLPGQAKRTVTKHLHKCFLLWIFPLLFSIPGPQPRQLLSLTVPFPRPLCTLWSIKGNISECGELHMLNLSLFLVICCHCQTRNFWFRDCLCSFVLCGCCCLWRRTK